MSRRVPTKLEVYEPYTSYDSPPDDVVDYEVGRVRVENGRADFVKHGKAIRMCEPSRPPVPWTSRPSTAALTKGDADALIDPAGLTTRQRERLQGWGFLAQGDRA
jgi:hypothetical protein